MNFFKIIIQAKLVSIYCFINKENKRIFITYCTGSIVPSILYNIEKYKGALERDTNKIQLQLIETYDNKNLLYIKWRVQELYNEYKELGYKFYNTSYKPLQWKLYVGVDRGSDLHERNQYRAIVKLKTSANVIHRIQSFDDIEEANNFVSSNTIGTVVRRLV